MMTKSPIALIALVSSVAIAQQEPGNGDMPGPGDGNIPAPDLFDSQIVCSNGLPPMPPTPSVVAPGATASQLDTAIGTGNVRITNRDVLLALGYVIPPGGSNCGQGADEDAFTVAGQGPVAVDVAEGYSALLPHFMAVYGDPDDAADSGSAGALQNARGDLSRAEADDTTSAARLAALRAAVTRAEEADTTARTGFNSIANGAIDDADVNPIYSAALAEWMAKSDVTRAIDDYNDAVGSANSAQTVVDAMNYEAYVPLGNDVLTEDVIVDLGSVSTVNLARLREYVNANGNTVATVDTDGVYDTSDSNFDTAGNIVAPNRLVNEELEGISQSTLVARVRTNLDERKAALATLKQLQTDNKNALLQPVIDEGVRRAQAEADYYQQQLRNALADDSNRNTVTVDNPATPENEAAPFSIASRHADHVRASNGRIGAEATLRAAAEAREAATQNVVEQFNNPASFYEQLVARREALKAVADQAVADATDPSMALTDAATAAAEALVDAQSAEATYQALVGDSDGPIDDLINTLLEPDGDDGQALVDALSQTYAKTTENRDAIDALTADTDDGAEEDGPITANRKAIEGNDGEIEAIGGRVTQNEQDIDALQGETEMMAGMVSTNAGNISTNAGNIVTNASFISQNAANIVTNGARIDVNAYNISHNSERIGANAAAIGMNSGMIVDNRQMIGELTGQLDMMRAGVAASIAISRMPSIDGGLSFGAGVYGGETALAVGFALDHKRTTFDFGVTSSGGEIGAGIGVGVKIWGD